MIVKQLMWLNRQGGRDESHVLYDKENKPYVLMYSPTALFHEEQVYIPEEKYLVY